MFITISLDISRTAGHKETFLYYDDVHYHVWFQNGFLYWNNVISDLSWMCVLYPRHGKTRTWLYFLFWKPSPFIFIFVVSLNPGCVNLCNDKWIVILRSFDPLYRLFPNKSSCSRVVLTWSNHYTCLMMRQLWFSQRRVNCNIPNYMYAVDHAFQSNFTWSTKLQQLRVV